MNRYYVPILVLLLFAGCRSHAPTVDPFFGRTAIPPPPTGSVTGHRADPYYQTPPIVEMPSPTASAPGLAPPYSAPRPLSTGLSASGPSTVVPSPGTASPCSPSGGNPTNQGSPGTWLPGSTSSKSTVSRPGLTVSLPASAGVVSGRAGASLNDRTPRPVDATGGGGSPSERSPIIRTLQPRATSDGSNRVIDIMDLPPAS